MDNDSVLTFDIVCYYCKRPMALSYCTQKDGRYYCQNCYEFLFKNELKGHELTWSHFLQGL